MKHWVYLLLVITFPFICKAQSGVSDSPESPAMFFSSVAVSEDAAFILSNTGRKQFRVFSECLIPDNKYPLDSLLKYPSDSTEHPGKSRFYPEQEMAADKMQLRNQDATFGRKILRGTAFVAGYDVAIVSYLLVAPERISKWDISERFKLKSIVQQYHLSYTSPPVVDHDLFVINYIGHPYQGAFMYNAVRSQGAKKWQSALYCTAHTLFWEYGVEGGFEQPSIQDLIVTPVAGILLGELCHYATLKMSRNGFRWYEKVAVSIINPMYALNNGFRIRMRNK